MTAHSRLTKAELIARLEAAEARPPVTWSDVPTLMQRTVSTVSRELPLFVKDCQQAGRWLRSCCTLVIDTYRRPIFKSQGT
jgi:hypothetical protein